MIMNRYFELTYNSIKNHGIKQVAVRFCKYLIVKVKRIIWKKDEENLKKWKALKGKYSGERVFVIGNGPSLNETALYLLKDEYKICFNHFNLMSERIGWKPDFYMVTDSFVIKDIFEELNKSILSKIKYAFFPDLHPSNTNFKKYIENRENVLWLQMDNPAFSQKLPHCGINATVVNAALQVMAYVGFSEIYILGVDASYVFENHKTKKINSRDLLSQEEDPNHFDPRYFGKGRKYHFQPMDEMIQRLAAARTFFERIGVKIYNSGVGGKLNVFERKDLYNVLNYDKEKRKELFMGVISNYIPDIDLSKEKIITQKEKFDAQKEYTVVSYELGKVLIPQKIMTHIAIGPYDNTYVFIKRKIKDSNI
jgi:hypothetical protein